MAKKIIIGFLLFSFLGLQAQKMTYREKAELFPAKGYKYEKGDAYSPAVASIFSFIIPGLGQVYANEPLRGLNFFAVNLSSYFMIIAGAQLNANSPITCNGGICKGEANGLPFVILGFASWLTTGIWSIIDANKVAKVNSQYEKSKNEKPISVTPNVGMINNQGEFVPAMGISLKF